ncbi:MAG: 23S rRNA (uracil(1939)-C(5))-methyltransferase RlmD [Cellulosilyticaceae bacterium]
MANKLEKNEIYELEIIDLGAEGEGIAKMDDLIISVPDTITGDVVSVKILKVRKKMAYGKVIKIIKPSIDRGEPVCEVSKKCGGCQLQHMNYEAQLEWKRSKVSNALFGIKGVNEAGVLPVLGMETPFNYRNKAQYPIRKVGGKVQIGFFASGTHKHIDWHQCGIQEAIHQKIIEKVKEFLETYAITIYDEKTHKGIARHLIIKTAHHTKEVMVCLVVNGKGLPEKDAFIESMKEIEGMKSILVNSNRSKTNVVLGNEMQVIFGEDFIVDSVGALQFKSSLLSYSQVNTLQAEVFYKQVLDYAALTGQETVWDVYSGSGMISLCLAQKAKKVYAVESVEQAVVGARENAVLNGMDTVAFFVGKAEEVVPDKYREGIVADVVVLDPPRRGCENVLLETFVQMKPGKVIYVSSDLETLARDLGYLCGRGYKVAQVQPIDMAPHTTNVEVCVLLVKNA